MALSVALRESFTIKAWAARRVQATAALMTLVAAVVAMALHPQIAALIPACPVRENLGLLCPGCGASHALLALLHGDVGAALRANALFVVLLPFAAVFAVWSYARAMRAGEFCWPRVPVSVLGLVMALTAVFTIGRNVI